MDSCELLCAIDHASVFDSVHVDDVEVVHADESMSIATADPVFWKLGDFECFSGKLWEGGFIKISNESPQPMQAISSESLF